MIEGVRVIGGKLNEMGRDGGLAVALGEGVRGVGANAGARVLITWPVGSPVREDQSRSFRIDRSEAKMSGAPLGNPRSFARAVLMRCRR